MGLTLEFYLGDKAKIHQAFINVDIECLYDSEVVHKKADFSLHIQPKDLNLLSHAFAESTGLAPLSLRDHLDVLVDEIDLGLLEVDTAWVNYIANASEKDVNAISTAWVTAMSREYEDEVIHSDDLTQAVADLMSICKTAKQTNGVVLHGWFL